MSFHHVLVSILNTGDEEGNERDETSILVEHLFQQVPVLCGPQSHSYRGVPICSKDAYALRPPGPEVRQAVW